MSSILSVHDQMRDRLVNGEFMPGQRLKVEELRGNYNCSASTMREILFRLSTLGLVDFQQQRGIRLPRQSRELQHNLT